MKKLASPYIAMLILAVGAMVVLPHVALAAVPVFQNCAANSDTAVCKATSDQLFGPGSVWSTILNTIIYVTGAISVLMIIVGGLRYTISNGDQGNLTNAKNTILYAVVGLVLSLMGFAIVNFVLSRI